MHYKESLCFVLINKIKLWKISNKNYGKFRFKIEIAVENLNMQCKRNQNG